MPRISCPNHPDCSIECPKGGYAYYALPYGPCVRGCDQKDAGDSLIKILRSSNSLHFGAMVGVTAGVIARFARDFEPYAPSDALGSINILSYLDKIGRDTPFNMSWRQATVTEVIKAIESSVGIAV